MLETLVSVLGFLFLITFIFKLTSDTPSSAESDIIYDEMNNCKKCGGHKKQIDKKDFWLHMKCVKCGCESKIYIRHKR